jgi:hypothetical protein
VQDHTKKTSSLGYRAPPTLERKFEVQLLQGACAMTLWETEMMNNVPQQVGNQGRKKLDKLMLA